MKIKGVSNFSHSGTRSAQEDFLHIDPEKGVFIVADGFGGAGPGLAAAQSVCESIKRFLYRGAKDQDATLPFVLRQYFSLAGNVLFNAVLFANQTLHRSNTGKNVHEKGGASAVAAYLDDDLLAIAHVGCCLAWIFRGDRFAPLVMPRTYGRLTDPVADPISQPDLQAPLMAYGMYPDLEPEISEYRIQEGDWIVLSTDGLLSAQESSVSLNQILSIKQLGLSPAEASQQFVSTMKSLRPVDNLAISLLIF